MAIIMRNLKIFTLLILLTISGLKCIGEEKQPVTVDTIILTKKSNSKSRHPKTPDRQVVSCSYYNGTIKLHFIYSEGNAVLNVRDENMNIDSYDVETSLLDVTIPVTPLYSTISIEVETAAGNTYYGELFL